MEFNVSIETMLDKVITKFVGDLQNKFDDDNDK